MTTTRAARQFRFTYETTVLAHQRTSEVEVWIPVASSTDVQDVGPLDVESPVGYEETHDAEWGNRMLYARVPPGQGDCTITVSYGATRRRHQVSLPPEGAAHEEDVLARNAVHLEPSANVPTDGFVAHQARMIVKRRDAPLTRARKVFDYLLRTLEYDWAGCTPDRIHELGNLAQACDLRKGTCTEFHGLYVGYARALGIPARFRFGFNIPTNRDEGLIAGYHCWCEILLPEVGWFPIDVSEAAKAQLRGQGSGDFFFGGTCCNRLHVSNGRDVWLAPRQPPPRLDKLIFSHAVREGEPFDPYLEFRFRSEDA